MGVITHIDPSIVIPTPLSGYWPKRAVGKGIKQIMSSKRLLSQRIVLSTLSNNLNSWSCVNHRLAINIKLNRKLRKLGPICLMLSHNISLDTFSLKPGTLSSSASRVRTMAKPHRLKTPLFRYGKIFQGIFHSSLNKITQITNPLGSTALFLITTIPSFTVYNEWSLSGKWLPPLILTSLPIRQFLSTIVFLI